MFSILNMQPGITNQLNAPVLQVKASESTITFNDVYFEYVRGQKILNGLSFTVPSGSKVAIVGGSGSGKSTIVRLLYRFFDPDQGQVLINGQQIQAVDLDSIRKSIGVVPQDCVLFHDSVYYNIAYGNLNATEAEVHKAAEMAEIHESVVTRFPDGYNTQVGERGLKLSGGEKQRVAIARAILKDAPILVFDEASSSLDSITEQNIMKALGEATRDRTSIIIAHRLSTVVNCDKILVLGKGQVVESGTHKELLAKEGSLYSELWYSQQFGSPQGTVNKLSHNKYTLVLNQEYGCGHA